MSSGQRLFAVATRLVPALALGHLALGVAAPPGPHFLGPHLALGAAAGWILRLALAVGAALCFVLGPGIAMRARGILRGAWSNPAFLWLPGFLFLLAVGVLAWLLAFAVDPTVTSTAALAPVPVLVFVALRPIPVERATDRHERLALALLLLLLLLGVGKATWSQGPEGELYAGTVSRTLEVGDRPDSRIPYQVIQLASNGLGPYGRLGRSYYAPYQFSDRGPIAGLAAMPIVLGGGANPPREFPSEVWEPFDSAGFATYRIVLMLLAATVLLGAFGLLRRAFSPSVALAGAALVATAPFVVHETYFTWPKLLSASFGLSALVLLLGRKPFAGGLLLGLGYVAHPSGLLVVPGVLLTLLVVRWGSGRRLCERAERDRGRTLAPWVRESLVAGVGVALFYLAWRVANGPHVANPFSAYVQEANGKRAGSFATWFDFRLRTLANTLVPFRLPLADGASRSVNSLYGPSPGIIRFSFSYFAAVPFAVGILYFPAYLLGLARFARAAAALFVVSIVLPFLGFVVYWGSSIYLLREGLHFVVIVSLLAAFIGHSVIGERDNSRSRVHAVIRVAALARLLEVLFMLVGPTIATADVLGPGIMQPTDVIALALIVAALCGLGWIVWTSMAPSALATPDAAAATGSSWEPVGG